MAINLSNVALELADIAGAIKQLDENLIDNQAKTAEAILGGLHDIMAAIDQLRESMEKILAAANEERQ